MPIWKLVPTGVESDDWRLSTYMGEVMVRASDEREARDVVTNRYGKSAHVQPGDRTLHNPWSQDQLVTCEQVSNAGYAEDGPTEILSPTQ